MDQTIEVIKFLENHLKKIEKLSKYANLSYWNAAASGQSKDYQIYERLQFELEKIYNNKEDFVRLKEWLNTPIADPLIKRQVKLLYNRYLGSQGDISLIKEIVSKSTELEMKFNTYRAKIEEREYSDNQISKILKTETKSIELQKAWSGSKKQGQIVEKQLIELIKLRNKLANQLGFKNYYELSLSANEQNSKDILIVFDELAKLTEEPFRRLKSEIDYALSKKYNVRESDLAPWHYNDLFFQEAPEIYKVNLDKYYRENILEIAKKFYKGIGLPVEDILENSDLYERKGKYQHAFCTNIDREGDVRIMENIQDNEKWMETTLHELGHAVYDKNIDNNLPFLLKTNAHIFVTEAIAQLFERNSKKMSFMRKYCHLSDEEATRISPEVEKIIKLKELVFSRWSQVMMRFEKALYENPDQNLNILWYQLVKKYQMLNFSRDKPDWASKIHFVSAPVYYHNYLLGRLLSSQLNNYVTKNILKQEYVSGSDYSNNLEVGSFLKKSLFSQGARYDWNETIMRATGEPLNPRYFAEEFVN